jgi:hypothetical protein
MAGRTSFLLALGFGVLIASAQPVFVSAAEGTDVVSCECEQSACGPCETEVGTSFYSAKCGPGNSRVKSCKKPTCEAVEDQKQCLADLAAKGETKVAAPEPVKPVEEVKVASPLPSALPEKKISEEAKPVVESMKARAPAAAEKASGEIVQLQGSAQVTHLKSQKAETARTGLRVFEGDLIETKAETKLKVRLFDSTETKTSSELILVSNSRVRLEQAAFQPEANSRAVLLNLLSGRVRSRVNQKYANFHIKTKAAVAGVRGTDFVTTFDPAAGSWRTEIRTLEGKVRLASAESDEVPGQLTEIGKGEYAAFVVENVGVSADQASEEELKAAIAKGFLTPTMKMPEEEAKLLDEATEFKGLTVNQDKAGARNTASASANAANDAAAVCSAPRGDFNQCSWTCEGNPAGEKRCRTDLPGVACVRRLCRANGQWAEATRLPASQIEACVPDKVVVRGCGNYW